MARGLTDEELTMNSTAKENDALQTLYPKAHGRLPILLYTQDNWAAISPLRAAEMQTTEIQDQVKTNTLNSPLER